MMQKSLKFFLSGSTGIFPFNQADLFQRQGPLELEIGFGTGEYLVSLAQLSPEKDFIGVEQCPGRIIKALEKINTAGVINVRLWRMDVALAMRYCFVPGSLKAVHCLFPCPWPKKRHAKHRLFSAEFLRLINNRMAVGAIFRLVTDHYPYGDWIAEQAVYTGFRLERRRILPRHGTKFEKKWLSAGQADFDELVFYKVDEVLVPDYQGGVLKTYFLDNIDASRVEFRGMTGRLSVQFRDFIFDAAREKGVVQAIISEDGCIQYLGVMIAKTQKGWCVCPVSGGIALPTEGVQTALRLAYESFQRSCS